MPVHEIFNKSGVLCYFRVSIELLYVTLGCTPSRDDLGLLRCIHRGNQPINKSTGRMHKHTAATDTVKIGYRPSLLATPCPALLTMVLFTVIAYTLSRKPMTMLSESQVKVVDSGETVVLECRFTAKKYNMFECPLLWRKMQRGEDSQVNIMGNINQPFLASGRYEVSFSPGSDDFRFTLTISDVMQEDSGNYTCEVRGPQSVITAQVTHFVLVRTPIQAAFIVENFNEKLSSESVIQIIEGKPSLLRCVIYGGFPPPDVTVFIGQHDVTHDFRVLSRANVTGSRGLRLITYRSERRYERFIARRSDHGIRTIQCVGTVPGLKPYLTSAVFDILYGPMITCTSETARLGEPNVCLKCEIRSNPRVFALFWVMDNNGTTLAEGEVIDEAWTLVMDRPDRVVESQLYLHKLDVLSFRTYTLVAENTVSTASADVTLAMFTTSNFNSTSSMQQLTSPSSFDNGQINTSSNNIISARSITRGVKQQQHSVVERHHGIVSALQPNGAHRSFSVISSFLYSILTFWTTSLYGHLICRITNL